MIDWVKVLISFDTSSETPESDIVDIFAAGTAANNYGIESVDTTVSIADYGYSITKQ